MIRGILTEIEGLILNLTISMVMLIKTPKANAAAVDEKIPYAPNVISIKGSRSFNILIALFFIRILPAALNAIKILSTRIFQEQKMTKAMNERP